MKIVVLMEDTASDPRFACEHGLSFYIETGDRRLLFDMGQTDLFLRNARTLGIDLAAVDTAFLSHGHYDHGGGLAAFLQVNDHAPVYVHERAFEPHFSRKPDGIRAIGLDRALADSPRLRYTTGVTQIDEQLTLLADIPEAVCAPQSGRVLLEQWAGTLAPDRFSHEQSLLVREGEQAVLFTGCAHRGVVGICARARALLGRDPDAVIGGTHLGGSAVTGDEPIDTIEAVAARLGQTASRYYTCHCTGQRAFAQLHARLGEQIALLAAGSVLDWERPSEQDKER